MLGSYFSALANTSSIASSKIVSFDGRTDGAPNVVPVGLEPVMPQPLVAPADAGVGDLDPGHEVGQVTSNNDLGFASLCQLLLSVLADGLEHLIAAIDRPALDVQHRALDQRRDVFSNAAHQWLEAARRIGRSDVEVAGEHRQPIEDQLLVCRQQVVRPGHCGAQTAMPVDRSATSGQQAEPVIQPVQQLRQPERRHRRGGQFDGQGQTVQPSTDLVDDRHLVGIRLEHPEVSLDSRAEQLRRLGAASGRFDRQRTHCDGTLTIQPQQLSTGRQDHDVRTVGHDRLDQLRDCIDQVLAVVQHQQAVLAAQCSGDQLTHVGARWQSQMQLGSDYRTDVVGRRQLAQFHQPRTIGETGGRSVRRVQRHRGLPNAAHAHQGHQRLGAQRRDQPLQLGLPTDQTNAQVRQVSRDVTIAAERQLDQIHTRCDHREQ